MPQILHTADVHLRSDSPERTDALRTCLSIAEEERVDVVTIGGDLFDGPEQADDLRPTLRNDLFADRPFPIILIPGNHDEDAFDRDVFFGDACTVLTDDPYEQWTDPAETIRVTGLPYRSRPDDELLVALRSREPFDGTEILLLHCSLEAPFGEIEQGDEAETRYFPVSREMLADLNFDYYLAGHYHSPHQLTFGDGCEFAYPGTPASTRSSETGRRQVTVLDTNRDKFGFRALDTFRYEREQFTATPGEEDETLEQIHEWANRYAVENAEASVFVDGYLETDEEAFNKELRAAVGSASFTDETRNIERVLNHPLLEAFETKLDHQDWEEETQTAVWQRTVNVFSRLAARGEI